MQPTATRTSELYERDFYEWAMANAALIREGRLDELDLENVAEEIESLGASQSRELRSRLRVLLVHLLKRELQPDKRDTRSWLTTIANQRDELDALLRQSPSLHSQMLEALKETYPKAVRLVRIETKQKDAPLSPECPWTAEQLLDPDFLP
jgi:hypothetical protein